MTTAEIGAEVLSAHGAQDATLEDTQGIALAVQHSLKNHEGKVVEIAGEARPPRWQLASKVAIGEQLE